MGYGGWVDGSTMNVTSFTSRVLPAVTLVSFNDGQVDKIVERNSRSTFLRHSIRRTCRVRVNVNLIAISSRSLHVHNIWPYLKKQGIVQTKLLTFKWIYLASSRQNHRDQVELGMMISMQLSAVVSCITRQLGCGGTGSRWTWKNLSSTPSLPSLKPGSAFARSARQSLLQSNHKSFVPKQASSLWVFPSMQRWKTSLMPLWRLEPIRESL